MAWSCSSPSPIHFVPLIAFLVLLSRGGFRGATSKWLSLFVSLALVIKSEALQTPKISLRLTHPLEISNMTQERVG